MFSMQEIIISSFYVRAAYNYLQSQFNTRKGKTRNAMGLLLFIQVIIIALDITIIVLDLSGYLKLKVIIHSFVYSVKLELEFVVLNQLIEISRIGVPGIPSCSHPAAATENVSRKDDVEGARVVANSNDKSTWRIAADSAVDLESCSSRDTTVTLDFITKPQHM
jgi:hypothetical protein